MTTENKASGFRATNDETFLIVPSGRAWIVSSPDFDGIKEVDPADIPGDAVPADDLLTPDECLGYCRQVQEESGEQLISG